ncbi:Ribosomal large subunit pseudouridine synthase D [Candidatus Rubidus massiliensis]|nr:MAG: 23S rRNA pseudouridylate synthase [Chlamydia sp. 32-24]CDZ80918.1 Ribosomal large subunit pseudouridine synthase D [Candidatus Rubidus massiliensis]
MNEIESDTFLITEEESAVRLDKILATKFSPQFSRTYFQYLIEQGNVLVNGEIVKKKTILSTGDEIQVLFSAAPSIDIIPENIPLNIVYEDDAIIVINKPANMVVHPAPGNYSGTIVNALLYHCHYFKEALEISDLRPGIVHRLDKDTSGLLVAAKTLFAQKKMIEQFANKQVYKEYAAICLGHPGKGEINAPIGRHPVHRKMMAIVENGKPALTFFETETKFPYFSLMKIVLKTGRTHQIRVHMESLNTPILGDSLYGNKRQNEKYKAMRQMLHAKKLQFLHPVTEQLIQFEAPIPEDMQTLLNKHFK